MEKIWERKNVFSVQQISSQRNQGRCCRKKRCFLQDSVGCCRYARPGPWADGEAAKPPALTQLHVYSNRTDFNKHHESLGQDNSGLDYQNYNLDVFPTTSHPCQKDNRVDCCLPSWPFRRLRSTSFGSTSIIALSTATLASRMSPPTLQGFSMATKVTIWSKWFWMTSRIIP